MITFFTKLLSFYYQWKASFLSFAAKIYRIFLGSEVVTPLFLKLLTYSFTISKETAAEL